MPSNSNVMPHDLRLREAAALDASAIAQVLIEAREAFMAYAPSPHPPAAVKAWVRDTLLPSGNVRVALVGGEVVGFMALSTDARSSWVDQLYVAPAYVNQGIGAQLLGQALASLVRPVRLYTWASNSGSRRFYERHGFEAIAFGDGSANEEKCPDVLYELKAIKKNGA
jgi:ribosomal protein S18 acetylase RimI-like enzyme